MDNFAGDGLMAVFGARVPFEIWAGGRSLPASDGHNGSARICHLHGGDAVGKPLFGHIEQSALTMAPPDAALIDFDRGWGESVSSIPVAYPFSICATSQLNDVNVSDAGMPT